MRNGECALSANSCHTPYCGECAAKGNPSPCCASAGRSKPRRPAVMGGVLGIVYRCIATHLIKKAGCSCKRAQTGVVTLIQRSGSALNLIESALKGSTPSCRPT